MGKELTQAARDDFARTIPLWSSAPCRPTGATDVAFPKVNVFVQLEHADFKRDQ